MSFECHERMGRNAMPAQNVYATQLRQVDEECGTRHQSTRTADELGCRLRRSPRRNQVIDDKNALARLNGILVYLDNIDTVFQRVFLADRLPGQLALLANGDEAATKTVSHCPTDDEAACFDASDRVDGRIREGLRQPCNGFPEAFGVAHKGCDVPKLDSRLGIIRNCAYQPPQIVHMCLHVKFAAQNSNISVRGVADSIARFGGAIGPYPAGSGDIVDGGPKEVENEMSTNFSLMADENPDDLPRTLRRERDARLVEAREREARARSSTLTHGFGAADPGYSAQAQAQPHAPLLDPVPAAVTRFNVPFLHLMFFFIKAVFAGIPALFILGVLLWLAGDLLQMLFPWLIKTQILIQFPN